MDESTWIYDLRHNRISWHILQLRLSHLSELQSEYTESINRSYTFYDTKIRQARTLDMSKLSDSYRTKLGTLDMLEFNTEIIGDMCCMYYAEQGELDFNKGINSMLVCDSCIKFYCIYTNMNIITSSGESLFEHDIEYALVLERYNRSNNDTGRRSDIAYIVDDINRVVYVVDMLDEEIISVETDVISTLSNSTIRDFGDRDTEVNILRYNDKHELIRVAFELDSDMNLHRSEYKVKIDRGSEKLI